ncbi:MAG TPA: hypothetical protein DCF78_08905 [Dehalococcoidia bacterium]|nr:hypothetical protein [Dehalococcoidia bacterium]
MISSRSDPRLRNFRRMMVNREAFMFTQDDLKFKAEECREWLGHILGSAVSAERAEAIAEQCEGWPGAMIMALQGSQIRPERNAGSEMFSESVSLKKCWNGRLTSLSPSWPRPTYSRY